MADGSFLVTSERSGWKHLYHYEKDGKLKAPVTKGDWDVRSVQRVDEKAGFVYFSGTKDSATASNAYRIKFDGSDLERLTKKKGNNQVQFSPKGSFFINTNSDIESPPQVRLHRLDGMPART